MLPEFPSERTLGRHPFATHANQHTHPSSRIRISHPRGSGIPIALRGPMPTLLRLSIATLLTLAVSAGPAAAATSAEQLLELSKAGLSDDILIALIQSDGSVFKLTAADVLALHRAGLSERVILAMASTAKPPAAPVAIRAEPAAAAVAEERPAPQPAPQPVVNVTQKRHAARRAVEPTADPSTTATTGSIYLAGGACRPPAPDPCSGAMAASVVLTAGTTAARDSQARRSEEITKRPPPVCSLSGGSVMRVS